MLVNSVQSSRITALLTLRLMVSLTPGVEQFLSLQRRSYGKPKKLYEASQKRSRRSSNNPHFSYVAGAKHLWEFCVAYFLLRSKGSLV